MNFKLFFFFFSILILSSCQKNDGKQILEQNKDIKKKELIFSNINKSWRFSSPSLNPKSQTIVKNWTELRVFLSELNQKPKSSIGAFQNKSKMLSKKASELNNNIPPTYNKLEIKSRIAVLTTKINSINLFINLQNIPDQKVIALIQDTNKELESLYKQMDEIVRKTEIPKEEGEADMIKMLDTARAIQNSTPPKPTVNTNLPFRKRKSIR